MLFDQARELPVATVRRAPQARIGLLVGALRRWAELRWCWLRPRTVPVLVAMLGMIAVLQSVSYLAPADRDPAATACVVVSVPAGVTIYSDGKPLENARLPMASTRSFHLQDVRLAPRR